MSDVSLALLVDLAIGIFFDFSFWFIAFNQYKLYKKYPFTALRFFFWGLFLAPFAITTVSLLLFLRVVGLEGGIISIFNTDIAVRDLLVLLYKFTYSLGGLGGVIFGLGLLTIKPREEGQTISISYVVMGFLSGFMAAAIFLTLEYDFSGLDGDIYIFYSDYVVAGLLTLVLILAWIGIRHHRLLTEVRELQEKPVTFKSRSVPIAYVSLVIGFIFLGVQRLPISSSLGPLQLALFFALPLSIFGIAFSYVLRKFPSLLVITSARLDSLLVLNQFGTPLYAYNFKKEEVDIDDVTVLLSGMLSALDLSISEALDVKEKLTSINFGDKCLMSRARKSFTIFLISSETNPVISELIDTLADRFEAKFGKDTSHFDGIDTEVYSSFTEQIEDLRQFAPLTT